MPSQSTSEMPDYYLQYTAAYRHDGSVCIVLSHFKPESNSQLYNWLTTDGHTSGTMCFRWIVPQVCVCVCELVAQGFQGRVYLWEVKVGFVCANGTLWHDVVLMSLRSGWCSFGRLSNVRWRVI